MLIQIKTKGHDDFVDITDKVKEVVQSSGVREGLVLVFVVGSTAAVTTIEYEDGVIQDLTEVLEKVAPELADWRHHQRWGDHNGAAHIKSAWLGTDLTVPIIGGQLVLGEWQQIVLVDFDEKPRTRKVVIKVVES